MSDASENLLCTPSDATWITDERIGIPYLQKEFEIIMLFWLDYFLSPAESIHYSSQKKEVYQEPSLM